MLIRLGNALMKTSSFERPSWPMGRVKVIPLVSKWLAENRPDQRGRNSPDPALKIEGPDNIFLA